MAISSRGLFAGLPRPDFAPGRVRPLPFTQRMLGAPEREAAPALDAGFAPMAPAPGPARFAFSLPGGGRFGGGFGFAGSDAGVFARGAFERPPASAGSQSAPPGLSGGGSQLTSGPQGVMRWAREINEASARFGIPADVIGALMQIESSGNPNALSPAGATGLMQVMPNFHAGRAQKYGGPLTDPRVNILVGVEIFKENFDRAKKLYGVDDNRAYEIAAAAYLGDWDWQRGQHRGAADAHGTTGPIYINKFRTAREQFRATSAASGGGGLAVGSTEGAITEAARHLGRPYVYGGANPQQSFDCSGLTQWSYNQAGIRLPRTAQAQFDATERVAQGQRGDLVFFHSTYDNPRGEWITHVGIYLGNGRMLHAGSNGTEIADLSLPYWRQKLAGFGRVRG